MPISEQVLDAIKSGINTAPTISARTGIKTKSISCTLRSLKSQGRIIALGEVTKETAGKPCFRWAVNPAWTPKRNVPIEAREAWAANLVARRADPEFEERRKVAHAATHAAREIEVPSWVMPSHRRTYREIARVLDETTASKWARGAKRISPKITLVSKQALAQNTQKC